MANGCYRCPNSSVDKLVIVGAESANIITRNEYLTVLFPAPVIPKMLENAIESVTISTAEGLK
jgi:hypothetical protein